MNIVNCSTRLPTVPGPYQVITKIKGTAHSHKGHETGISWNGTSWDGAGEDTVIAWADPNKEIVQVVVPVISAPTEDPMNLVVTLTGTTAAQRIGVIKLIRELNKLSLGDAKTFVDTVPKMVRDGLSVIEANDLKTQIEAAGGIVTIKTVA
jgi:large subunit ribosomal protein L7/L12